MTRIKEVVKVIENRNRNMYEAYYQYFNRNELIMACNVLSVMEILEEQTKAVIAQQIRETNEQAVFFVYETIEAFFDRYTIPGVNFVGYWNDDYMLLSDGAVKGYMPDESYRTFIKQLISAAIVFIDIERIMNDVQLKDAVKAVGSSLIEPIAAEMEAFHDGYIDRDTFLSNIYKIKGFSLPEFIR